MPPFGGRLSELEIPGKTHTERWEAVLQLCGEQYFETVGVRFVQGRGLSEQDVAGGRKVTVVNRALVERYFGSEDPLGKQLRLTLLERPQYAVAEPVFEIVGVVENVRNQGVREAPMPQAYLPSTIVDRSGWNLLVRTAAPVASLSAVRAEIRAADRNVAVNVFVVEESLQRSLYAQPRFSLLILTAFASTGMLLVAIGVYSVLAYTVSRQTQEIALRMALGASRGDVLKVVLRLGMRLVAVGIAVGLLASFATNRLIYNEVGHQLMNASPYDPVTLAVAVGVITLMGLAACYLPALRALRVDPMQALRHE